MMNIISHNTIPLPLVRGSIWGTSIEKVTWEDFDEMRHHSILALPAQLLASVEMPKELHDQWKTEILKQISYNVTCRYAESVLPISVPYVVLKGTSAAQYYPNPELRTLGDIDILTKPEDTEAACESLLLNGYRESTSLSDIQEGRHRTFTKNGILVEVHYSFAIMNDPEKAKMFDSLIFEQIGNSHVLPDLMNGLILIEHINQHLESGLGLRHVIDWMLFADKCLTDETAWTQFMELATRVGLETLATATTRMCEMYLGMPAHPWRKHSDESLCSQLMRHVLTSGNFGRKKTTEEKKSFYRFIKIRHPNTALKELQQKGKEEWKNVKIPGLRAFAWLWKGTQFIKDIPFMAKHYCSIKRHKKMLEELGVVIKDLDQKQ
ncbi:MAG: nucleotidyltransferase family protein [Clostridia bacterium]|nr:nucleotidyltransferase family protein [Clostridia bacterium]